MIVMAALLSFSAAAAPGRYRRQRNADPYGEERRGGRQNPRRFQVRGARHADGGHFLLGSGPPFGLYARDNKTVIGSEADIARPVADGLGLKLKLVPTSWEDWPLGWPPANMTPRFTTSP